MLHLERVRSGHRHEGRIAALYERSFPENERRPLGPLMDDESGAAELLALYDDGMFVGFACVLCWRDIRHIIYFAVEESLRGRGYGAQTLKQLYLPGRRLIADVEEVTEGAPNAAQRARRIEFYRRCGFERSSVRYNWRAEEYVILSRGGDITPREFGEFWRGVDEMNPEMAQY